MALLELAGVSVGYGALPVLHELDLRVDRGATTVVLGRPGSGRSALALTIAGVLRPWVGTLTYDGEDVTAVDAEGMVARRVVLVPEGRRVFPTLSVAEHLAVGAWTRRAEPAFVVEEQEQRCYRHFPRLDEARRRLAGTLSAAEQQMLVVCRALMARPRVLVVDEPSRGLPSAAWEEILRVLREVGSGETTVVVCEQNPAALRLADRAVLLHRGEIVQEGSADELRRSAHVRQALLAAG